MITPSPTGGRIRRLAGLALAAALAAVPLTASAAQAASPSDVTEVPITFQVRAVNESKHTCLSGGDGSTYAIKGHLTGTESALSSPDLKATTLYTHGHGYGELFWNFKDVPGYNYVAEQAKEGLVSVSIDKLGYGASGIPDGRNTCFGIDATVQHQIVEQLKAGTYGLQGRKPVKFSRVALAGHAQGGNSAEVAAFSFDNIDALVELTLFDAGFTPGLLGNFGINLSNCLTSPLPQDGPDTPGGYQFREITNPQFQADNFFNTDPQVLNAATNRRSKDPCGYPLSAAAFVATSNALVQTIDIPVHLVEGDHDAQNIGGLGILQQSLRFPLSKDVTATTLKDTGQAVTLERTAPELRKDMAQWLKARGFATPMNGTVPGTTQAANGKAKLRVTMGTPKQVTRGGTSTIKVRVRNASSAATASKVRLRVAVPKGLRLSGSKTRSVGTLAARRAKTITLRVRTGSSSASASRVRVRATGTNASARSASARVRVR